jgi:hypothetical protein
MGLESNKPHSLLKGSFQEPNKSNIYRCRQVLKTYHIACEHLKEQIICAMFVIFKEWSF